MTVAAVISVDIRMRKGDGNMKANSAIAVIIKDNFQKKAVAFMDSAVNQKNETEHMINNLNSKVGEVKEDIIS